MHLSAIQSFIDFKKTYLDEINHQIKIVEIGSQSINESIKKYLKKNFTYIGADIEKGENVDLVLKDPYKLPFDDNSIDVIISI